jgi:hypothetical protein
MSEHLQALESLVQDKPDYVQEALEAWFKKVPKEEADRPAIAAFGLELEPIMYTPREIYETLTVGVTAQEVAPGLERFLSEVVRMHKEANK